MAKCSIMYRKKFSWDHRLNRPAAFCTADPPKAVLIRLT